jgi:hypothetical protein
MPAGQRDYSGIRLTRHALERFEERFRVTPEAAEAALRLALRRTRRLGRNPETGAIAVLGLHEARVLVAILQEGSCLTVMTWALFEPRLSEFGRKRLPRKRGRMLERLVRELELEMGAGGRSGIRSFIDHEPETAGPGCD